MAELWTDSFVELILRRDENDGSRGVGREFKVGGDLLPGFLQNCKTCLGERFVARDIVNGEAGIIEGGVFGGQATRRDECKEGEDAGETEGHELLMPGLSLVLADKLADSSVRSRRQPILA